MDQKIRFFWILLLTGVLTFPSAVEFAHVFAGHQHNYCDHYSDSHFHQDNVECEIISYHKTYYPSVEFFSYSVFFPETVVEKSNRTYHFLSTYQPLTFSQRGPPVQV